MRGCNRVFNEGKKYPGFPRKGVEISWRSSVGHSVSLPWLSVSSPISPGHILPNTHTLSIDRGSGSQVGEISHHVGLSWSLPVFSHKSQYFLWTVPVPFFF